MFLLTEESRAPVGAGLTLERSEEADDLLLEDIHWIRSEWVPEERWLSYLSVSALAEIL